MPRETWADIYLNRLENNYKLLTQQSGKEIFGVVKANAYGHGEYEISKKLLEIGCPILCVSSLDEALSLTQQGINSDILIFSYVHPDDIKMYHHENYIYTVPSLDWYESIKGIETKLRLHVEINTGMNRYGIKNYSELANMAKNHSVEGIYTHFQSPVTDDTNREQLQVFKEVYEAYQGELKWVHVGNAPFDLVNDENWINGMRVGLGMYGYRSNTEGLEPVLELKSKITHLDTALVGETIGYDYSYEVKEAIHFATMPIGYADGFDRRQSHAPVWIRDQFYPIIGKICMDQTMIKVDKQCLFYDEIELIGKHRTCAYIEKLTGIIPYIQLSTLSHRIRRVYHQ